jgi:hypothetical protein
MDVERTPTAETLGTGEHMDSAQLKLGARVYNKNGKLMAVDLNRQVENFDGSLAKPPRRAAVRLGAAKGCG